MDFRITTIDKTIKSAIKGQLLLLYSLGKKQEEVEEDSRRAVKNITEWLDLVLKGSKNQFGLQYS
jgi:DNA replication factor Dna2